MNETLEGAGYSSLRDNPISKLCLVDKYVRVELIKYCSFEGFIHSFDPVTNSIILLIPQGNGFKTAVLPGHAILDVTEQAAPSNIVPPTRVSDGTTQNDTLPRKIKLIEWLKSNFLPVTDVNDKIIFGDVSILPPYSVTDICTDNPMVAMQIKKLIENMPEDNTG